MRQPAMIVYRPERTSKLRAKNARFYVPDADVWANEFCAVRALMARPSKPESTRKPSRASDPQALFAQWITYCQTGQVPPRSMAAKIAWLFQDPMRWTMALDVIVGQSQRRPRREGSTGAYWVGASALGAVEGRVKPKDLALLLNADAQLGYAHLVIGNHEAAAMLIAARIVLARAAGSQLRVRQLLKVLESTEGTVQGYLLARYLNDAAPVPWAWGR